MLEDFFSDHGAIVRHREGLFGSYIDEFAVGLSSQGHKRFSIRFAVWSVSRFGCWLSQQNLTVHDVSEKTISEFRQRHSSPSWVRHGGDAVLRTLLERLRHQGVVLEPVLQIEFSDSEQIGHDFGRYLREERALSAVTVTRYSQTAERFISERFGTKRIGLSKLSAEDIHDFVFRHARDYCPKTIQLMLSGLRSFLRFLYLSGQIPMPMVEHVPTLPSRRRTELPKWLSTDEIERVLDCCDCQSAIGQRDFAILLLLARLGLRAGEVVSLELADIHWETAEINVCGKGQQRKGFPLLKDVGEAVASYLRNARPPCRSRRVFLRVKAPYQGLGHSSTIDTIVSKALLRAGLEPPCKGAHLFRHSLATNMLRNGASLTEIGQILHHSDPDTTAIYAKVDTTGLRSLAQPWPGDGS